ncbi:MAG TPA: ATP-binding protein [Solirubrobacteraceae bacterium]|nr:ATP-binding protein [Solirubrobacteraceae bacterium]
MNPVAIIRRARDAASSAARAQRVPTRPATAPTTRDPTRHAATTSTAARPTDRPPTPSALTVTAIEVILAVGLATAGVAALQSTAPATGLGVLYLLSVLAIAIRRGERAALVTALVSVITLNYLYIPPRHQLTIAHSQDVVELVVLLIAAVVVGRLAAVGRQRATESEGRARVAAAREREATLVADAASAVAAGGVVTAQLDSIARRVAVATGASRARVALEPVPSPRAEELAVGLGTRIRAGWLYVSSDADWSPEDLQRISGPLGRLIDVALERERVAEQSAETEAAKRGEVAKTAVLHAISHDLRSPITAITTAGSALGAAGLTSDERGELTDVIQTESARLARLVDDLLDLSKIEARAVDPRADWCDLRDVVASAAAQLDDAATLEFGLPPDLPLVRADATQLERVFTNLIENAIKFSPSGAPVRITGGTTGGRVTVRVIDSGRGIPPQHQAQVFEPFFRGRGATDVGSGLGLAICRGFVEANGGKITLQTGTDRGTSFAVTFPVPRQPQTVP